MNNESYEAISTSEEFDIFEFVCIGKTRNINKQVRFKPLVPNDLYSLQFGDIDENGNLDYYSVSGNGDSEKILTTVSRVVDTYTMKHPNHYVVFGGSTPGRTRLYRMAIGKHLEYLSMIYEIYSCTKEKALLFKREIEAFVFLIKRKKP